MVHVVDDLLAHVFRALVQVLKTGQFAVTYLSKEIKMSKEEHGILNLFLKEIGVVLSQLIYFKIFIIRADYSTAWIAKCAKCCGFGSRVGQAFV